LKNYSINALYIPNAVDTKRFNSKHTSINETIGNFVLCTFGSVCKRKRVDVAIKVVASLKEKGIPVLLKIIGPTEGFGEYEEEYLDYIKNFISVNELDDSVQFLGMVDKPELELKQCDVLLFPSESEGMPNALLEAMACGVVPISNAIPGTEEIIHNDENGFLVKENNLEQYISHCLELYNDKSRLFELSEKAVDFIRNHHDKTVIYKKYRKLFT
ncbi:MAG: glycosyltransferase family 4 protein, partial [Candidatus Paceibacterota bacterium]